MANPIPRFPPVTRTDRATSLSLRTVIIAGLVARADTIDQAPTSDRCLHDPHTPGMSTARATTGWHQTRHHTWGGQPAEQDTTAVVTTAQHKHCAGTSGNR